MAALATCRVAVGGDTGLLHLAVGHVDPAYGIGTITTIGCFGTDDEGMLHGDPTPMFLDIATIAAAVDAVR